MGAGQGIVIAAWWGPVLGGGLVVGLLGLYLLKPASGNAQEPCAKVYARACGILFLLSGASLYFSNDQSMSLVIYQEGAAAYFLGFVALGASKVAWRGQAKRDGPPVSTRARVGATILALLFTFWTLKDGLGFVEDVFLPDQRLVGVIQTLVPGHLRFSYYVPRYDAARVQVHGDWFYATSDIEPRLHVGASIEADVGAGSGYILALKEP